MILLFLILAGVIIYGLINISFQVIGACLGVLIITIILIITNRRRKQ